MEPLAAATNYRTIKRKHRDENRRGALQ